jgi:perosamine synthetase
MPVHLFGLSSEMREIMRIAKKYKLYVLEDSCEALGVQYRGRPIASLGDMACFSFYMQHLITTGVGGMVLTNDKALADRVRSLVNHGRDPSYTRMDDDKGLRDDALRDVIEKRFSFISVGHSHRITELEGALGVAQVRELKKNLKIRRFIAEALIQGLSKYKEHLQLPTCPPYAEHAFMMFPIILCDESMAERDALVEHLEQWNIETRALFPLLSQPIYKNIFGDIEHEYPNARRALKRGFYIGCHPEMARTDVDYILAVFDIFFDQV